MPTLTIPACGYTEGTKPTTDDGIKRVKAISGTMRGWSNYDNVYTEFFLNFGNCTQAEALAQKALYGANRLTGGMQFIYLGDGLTYVCEYLSPVDPVPRVGNIYSVDLHLRGVPL